LWGFLGVPEFPELGGPEFTEPTIALAAWWNISHGVVMVIQTVEAWIHGVHRNFTDVIVSNLAIARPDQLRFARKSFMDCRAAVLIGSIPFSQ